MTHSNGASGMSRRALLQLGLAATGAWALAACGSNGGGSASASPSGSSTGYPEVPTPQSQTEVKTAQQAAGLVEWGALQAAQAGSYGIAGALVDQGRTILVRLNPAPGSGNGTEAAATK